MTALLLLAGVVGGFNAQAVPEVSEITLPDIPPGTTALGAGIRLNGSIYRYAGDDIGRIVDFIPLFVYDGKRVFLRGTSGGIHLLSGDNLEINLLARYRFEHLDPDSDPYYSGINERERTIDAGVEVALSGRLGDLNVNWLTDAFNRHNGNDFEISYHYDIKRGRWVFSPFVTWSRHDRALTEYYYGVSAAEARPDRPEYHPGDSRWTSVGLDTSWWLSDRVSLFANLGFGGPDSAVTDSPLVVSSTGTAAFLGGLYVFGNVRRPDPYVSAERRSEWSWRINYGYQAEGNIVGDIDQGEFRKNHIASTNIAGLMVGKLLNNGPRADIQARFAVYRHFEEEYGNGNFFSFAAYVMALGRGYLPWSNKERFRWGFGFGVSYANRIPITEEIGAAKHKKEPSRLLSYLEMTLDYPLARLFRSEHLRNCYAGLTTVHRSGIFGSSQFLGGFSGGSDWITAHLECVRR